VCVVSACALLSCSDDESTSSGSGGSTSQGSGGFGNESGVGGSGNQGGSLSTSSGSQGGSGNQGGAGGSGGIGGGGSGGIGGAGGSGGSGGVGGAGGNGVGGAGGNGVGGGGGTGGNGVGGGGGAGGVRPVQFDVSSVLNSDSVTNNGSGGTLDTTQTAIDRSNFTLITQSVARMFSTTGVGLPDDAFFPANADHPDIQLHWNNSDDGVNSRLSTTTDTFTFAVPAAHYEQVQVFGLSTEGPTTLEFTLTYDAGTPDVRTVTFPDWFTDPVPAGVFYIIDGMDRFSTGYVSARDPAVAGASLAPDATKTLVSITVTKPATNFFVFLGALGY
jgi:hypothetical protein